MTEQDFLKLKNGTDVRGTAVAGVEGDPVTLTDEAVLAIAKAFTVWAAKKTGVERPTVAVGHDSRISAPALSEPAAGPSGSRQSVVPAARLQIPLHRLSQLGGQRLPRRR